MDPSVLVRQPFILINGGLVSDDEVVDYMRRIGFEESQRLGGYNPSILSEYVNRSFNIADLHKENIARFDYPSGDSLFFVIDYTAYFSTPSLRLDGFFCLENQRSGLT